MMSRILIRFLMLSVLAAPALFPQGATIQATAPSPNRMVGQLRSPGVASQSQATPLGLVRRNDVVFPHLVTGNGWETLLVITNIGNTTVDFNQYFYDETGSPMSVRLRTIPDNELIDTTAVVGHLPVGTSVSITLYDATAYTISGWSNMDYDSVSGRLGGYAAFRLRAGGVVNEGLVPLSSSEDTAFAMPFDNSQGFATGIALTNPASNLINHVQVVALDRNGTQIASDALMISASGHRSYVLTDRMPAVAGQIGTLVVTSDLTKLSAVGIRMNVAGGMTFTSIPIMSWVPGL